MSVTSHHRIERLKRLESLIPSAAMLHDECPDGTRLQEILSEVYGSRDNPSGRRALERDLQELTKDGRIEAVDPLKKPRRYRRCADDLDEDPLVGQYTLQQIRDLVAEAVPAKRLDRLWQRLLSEIDPPPLDEQRVRTIPDTFRLQPVEIYPAVLHAVIRALAEHSALQVLYENANAERGEPILHPQALLQRGPIPYLVALKNDETAPFRLYALHRMIRAEVLTGKVARTAENFDLDAFIRDGKGDFGEGELVKLELRVRGYLDTVLRVCPLSADQKIEDEPEDSDFTLRACAQVPSTGQLLRWLLGAGDNLEVLAPEELRHVVAMQAAKMAALYQE
ncbi:WYL domain-containing protein [Methylolobus aquaticus]|nr:WYL domain-containing protein [Methylolobus aquaticus]